MLSNVNQIINMNATSTITVDDKSVPVTYMNATIPNDGKFSINRSIQNEEVYFANVDEVEADVTEFTKKVADTAKGLTTEE